MKLSATSLALRLRRPPPATGVPANALLDMAGNPVLDMAGNYILDMTGA